MTRFGEWHQGFVGGYDVRVEHTGIDTYPNNFRALVQVRERHSETVTGNVVTRMGTGKYIGNLAPIWISWKGERTQIDSLLRVVDRGRMPVRQGRYDKQLFAEHNAAMTNFARMLNESKE